MRRRAAALSATLLALAAGGCGGQEEVAGGSPAADEPGPVHVHGLGLDPGTGDLFVATHTGTWRLPEGSREPVRVGESRQDTMGFTVVGPGHFLGSGHPDVRGVQEHGLPPLLGLIESRDAGLTWTPVSLLGEADFHVLRAAGDRIYGYDASNDRLLVSTDRGETWLRLDRPAPVFDLAVHPREPRRVVAATESGIYESADGGRTWRALASRLALLAWPAASALYLVDGGGDVHASSDGGRTWTLRGNVGGEPAAFLGHSARALYAALHDGAIVESRDGGRTWSARSGP